MFANQSVSPLNSLVLSYLGEIDLHRRTDERTSGLTSIFLPKKLTELPCAVIMLIFGQLTLRDLCRVARVSRKMRDLSYDPLMRTQRLEKTMRELFEEETEKTAQSTKEIVEDVLPAFPTATAFRFSRSRIDFSAWPGVTGELVKLISQSLRNLNTLKIDASPIRSECPSELGDDALDQLASDHPGFKVLKLEGCKKVTNQGMVAVLHRLSELEELKLVFMDSPLDKSVIKEILSLEKLRNLNISDITNEVPISDIQQLISRFAITDKKLTINHIQFGRGIATQPRSRCLCPVKNLLRGELELDSDSARYLCSLACQIHYLYFTIYGIVPRDLRTDDGTTHRCAGLEGMALVEEILK